MPGEKELIEARQKFDEGLREMFAVIGRVPPLNEIEVTKGDTLWQLAARHLGTGQRWREIYIMNLDVMFRGQAEHDAAQGPDMIYPGSKLTLFAV